MSTKIQPATFREVRRAFLNAEGHPKAFERWVAERDQQVRDEAQQQVLALIESHYRHHSGREILGQLPNRIREQS